MTGVQTQNMFSFYTVYARVPVHVKPFDTVKRPNKTVITLAYTNRSMAADTLTPKFFMTCTRFQYDALACARANPLK